MDYSWQHIWWSYFNILCITYNIHPTIRIVISYQTTTSNFPWYQVPMSGAGPKGADSDWAAKKTMVGSWDITVVEWYFPHFMGWHESYFRNFRLVTQIASHPGECFLDCSSYRFYRVLSSLWSCRRIILRYGQPLATVFTMNAWKHDMICIYIWHIRDKYFTWTNIWRWRESELWGPHAKGEQKILCDAPLLSWLPFWHLCCQAFWIVIWHTDQVLKFLLKMFENTKQLSNVYLPSKQLWQWRFVRCRLSRRNLLRRRTHELLFCSAW